MNSIHRSAIALRTLVIGAALGVIGAVWASAPGTTMSGDVAVPTALIPPAGQSLTLSAHATGVQIYVCTAARDEPAKFAWIFKAPEATLRDASKRLLGKHYAGPTWEAVDGSKVVGELVAKADAPVTTAIPWLLLRAKSSSGSGTLGAIAWIQRLATVGGLAPASGCDSTHADAEARVEYSAEYRFFVTRDPG